MNNEMTTDNMSNEEVIEVLKGIVFNGFDRTTRKERQALDLAIKALEERPQGDLISREALKKAIKDNGYSHYFEIFDIIDNAPTVSDRYDEGFRNGYAKCINDREEKKEHNRLFGKEKPHSKMDRKI